jgi:hypothetical protein
LDISIQERIELEKYFTARDEWVLFYKEFIGRVEVVDEA